MGGILQIRNYINNNNNNNKLIYKKKGSKGRGDRLFPTRKISSEREIKI
jgi:hypothetical protein